MNEEKDKQLYLKVNEVLGKNCCMLLSLGTIKDIVKANEQLQKSHFSNVMRSLQKKKKLWEIELKKFTDARESVGVRATQKYLYYTGCIEQSEDVIKDLQEVIDRTKQKA